MKKLVLFSGVFALTASFFVTPSVAGCVNCEAGTEECTRVITHGTDSNGNPSTTVHIFHGKATPCGGVE